MCYLTIISYTSLYIKNIDFYFSVETSSSGSAPGSGPNSPPISVSNCKNSPRATTPIKEVLYNLFSFYFNLFFFNFILLF